MSKAQDLLQNLKENAIRIEGTLKQLETLQKKTKYTETDMQEMESLHRKEFSLYMDNSSLYEDLMEELEAESEFTRKRLADEANKLLKVEIVVL